MNRESGMTLLEVLAVLAILGIAVGIALVQLRPLEGPLETTTSLVEGLCREARLNAIATSSAYRISPDGPGGIKAEQGTSCSATTWTPDSRMGITLPTGVSMEPANWSVCFSSRGICDTSLMITFTRSPYGIRKIEVMVGGTTRVTS